MTRLLRGLVPAIALALLLAACAGQPDRPAAPGSGPASTPGNTTGTTPGSTTGIVPVPAPAPRDGAQVGVASWYGAQFQGRTTASGEPFDMYAMTAAHPNLPFGTKVRVTNLANGRSVVVRINDRGPYAKKRIIDVSRRAAEQLGFRRAGVAKVRIEVI
jgi:peptidoglycan lytic transglycosylase